MQDQDLREVKFNAGVVKEQTPSVVENYWIDADKVRFRFGKPELMGGWQNVTTAAKTLELWGTPRAIETVRILDGTKAAVVGTDIGVYSSDLSEYNNITPIRLAQTTTDVFNTSIGSTEVVVSMPGHGLTNNTVVGFTSATTTIGGTIQINADSSTERLFSVSVRSSDAFVIQTSTTAAATSAATGGATTIRYHINAGDSSNVAVGGWGTGVWSGAFGWGTSPDGITINRLSQWSFDLWGTDVVGTHTQGKLYIWKPSTGTGITDHMTLVTAAPSLNNLVRVASEQRHVIMYGTHDISGTYDPLLIRWCSQENYDDWTTSATNTAGEFRLGSRGSEIVSVHKVGDRHIILTDADLFVQTYIGPTDVFGFVRGAEKCGAISQNGAVEYKGILYWMSNAGQFYKYDGRVQSLPCTVLRYIFDNLNVLQKEKVIAGTISEFDEIIWFYPSSTDSEAEPDRYAIYSVAEDCWTIGELSRTAWHDRGTFSNPLATGTEGAGMFYHESGYSDDGAPLVSRIQSGYFDLQGGNKIMFANKFSADFSDLVDGEPYTGSLNINLKSRKYPGYPIITKGPYHITGTTGRVSTRLRGREFSIQFSSQTLGNTPWRMGNFRLAYGEDGDR